MNETEEQTIQRIWELIKVQEDLGDFKPTNITNYLPHLSFGTYFIAGGAARQFFESNTFVEARDIDIFFAKEKYYLRFLGWLERNDNAEEISRPEELDDRGYPKPAPVYSTQYFKFLNYTLNLVNMKPYHDAWDTIAHFDLTVTQFATDGKSFLHTPSSIDDLSTRTVRFVNKEETVKSFDWPFVHQRIQKYFNYGFEPDDEITLEILADGDYLYNDLRNAYLKSNEI